MPTTFKQLRRNVYNKNNITSGAKEKKKKIVQVSKNNINKRNREIMKEFYVFSQVL